MKRFSLNKKRVSKVLALALVAAMVVPGVPAQKAVAEDDGSEVTLPTPIATVNFASDDAYDVSDSTTGKQLKFTETTAASVWKYAESDVTGASTDYLPEMKEGKDALKDADKYSEANYMWEDIDAAPTTVEVTGDVVSGTALALKDSVDTKTYPAASKNSDSITAIQRAKRYSSGVKVANPFANNTKLYDADRYSFENIYNTASEVTLSTPAAIANASLQGKNGGAYTTQKTDAGVTISFWAQTPVGDKQLAPTNYFEFYNDSNLVYQSDDIARFWMADMLKTATEGAIHNEDSPFYVGEVVEDNLALVGTNKGDSELFKAIFGKSATEYGNYPKSPEWLKTDHANNATIIGALYDATAADCTPAAVKYVKNYGEFAPFSKEAIQYYKKQGAFQRTSTQKVTVDGEEKEVECGSLLVVHWVGTIKEIEQRSENRVWVDMKNELYVKSGKKDSEGNDILYGLRKTWWLALDEDEWQYTPCFVKADVANFGEIPTEKDPTKLDASLQVRYKTDATGVLYVGQTEGNKLDTQYGSDFAVPQNDLGSNSDAAGYTGKYKEKGKADIKTGNLVSDGAGIQYDALEVTPNEWHYYTITITDSWIQMYVDGEALDIASGKDPAWANKYFNLGSGLYDPVTDLYVNANSAQSYNGYRLGGSHNIYSKNYDCLATENYPFPYILQSTIMKLITDPTTDLYIGGKTQKTAEGTLIADVDFYDEPLTPEQAAALYEKVTSEDEPGPGPTPGPTNALGNVTGDTDKDGNPIINSQDALAVLQYSVGIIDAGPGFDLSVANVNGDTDKTTGEPIINSQDALEILQYSVGIIDHFSAESAED